MGWLFGHSTKKELVEHLLKQHGEHCELIDHSLTGNKLWLLFNHKVEPFGRFIVLCLLQGAKSRGYDPCRWGYKDMDESSGPYYYDCPERLLAQSTDTSENAVAWRKHCREARVAKAKHKKWIKSLRPGNVIIAGDKPVTVRGTWADPSKVWIQAGCVVCDSETGLFRFRQNQLRPMKEPA